MTTAKVEEGERVGGDRTNKIRQDRKMGRWVWGMKVETRMMWKERRFGRDGGAMQEVANDQKGSATGV